MKENYRKESKKDSFYIKCYRILRCRRRQLKKEKDKIMNNLNLNMMNKMDTAANSQPIQQVGILEKSPEALEK